MATAGNSSTDDEEAKRNRGWEKLKMEIRSILLTAPHGLTLHDLLADFEDLNGRTINPREHGYQNAADLIRAMPDTVAIQRSPDGQVKLKGISHTTTRHLESLISRQRPGKTGRFGGTEQHQQSEDQRRRTAERRKVVENRLLEIAGRINTFTSYSDICRKYRATYGEPFDPKIEFNCNAKAVFTTKLARHFAVAGKGPNGFMIRLRDMARWENRDVRGDGRNPPPRATTSQLPNGLPPRMAAQYGNGQNAKENYAPRSVNNTSAAGYRRPVNGYGTNNRGTAPRFFAPRFAAAASNNFAPSAPPTRYPDLSASNNTSRMQASHDQFSSSTRSLPSPSSSQETGSTYSSLCVTVSSSKVGPPLRSVAMAQPNPPPKAAAASNTSPRYTRSTPSKQRLSELLFKYPNGIELSILEDAYFTHFKQVCDMGVDVLQRSFADICEVVWNESALRHYVKPKMKDPLSSLANVVDALPSISVRQPQQVPAGPAMFPVTARPPPLSFEELKQQCKMILRRHPSGIAYLRFPMVYEALIGHKLDLTPYNLLSLSELVKKMSDIFRVDIRGAEPMLFENKELGYGMVQNRNGVGLIEKKPLKEPKTKYSNKLLDEIWLVLMNARNYRLYEGEIQEAYKKMFGVTPDVIWENFILDVFDYMEDRFEFLYEGSLIIIAQTDYVPATESVKTLMGQLEAARKESTRVAYGATDFILPDEHYVNQSFPGIDPLVTLNDDDFSQTFEVYVAQVENPGRFFIRLSSTDSELNNLLNDMNGYYSGASNILPINPNDVQVGLACACRWADDGDADGIWYRGSIKNLDSEMPTILLVDYGTEIYVPYTEIYYLARRFFQLPAQAIECKLAYLSPSGEQWSLESGDIMSQFCGSAVLTAEIRKVSNGVPNIWLVKNQNGNEVPFNEVLLEANIAVFNDAEIQQFLEDDDDSASNAVGGKDDNTEQDEQASPTDTNSVHSFRTAIEDESNLADASASLTTPAQVLDDQLSRLLDVSFEQDVMNQLKVGQLGADDLEIVMMAKTVLCRKRVALTRKLTSENNALNSEIVDKLAWLEQQIHWLIQETTLGQ